MTSSRRRGGVSIATLLLIPLMFLALALALFAAEAVRAKAAQRNCVDASALAFAGGLIDDAGLSKDPRILRVLYASAEQQGCEVARKNLIFGVGVELRPTDRTDEPGDLVPCVCGTETPLEPLNLRGIKILDLPRIEAVQVTGHRTRERGNPVPLLRGPFLNRTATDVITRATVMIDRDIIGIRPLPGIAAPLAPIALLSDPSGIDELSWEYQTELERGGDYWALDRSTHRPQPVPGRDGLFEMEVRFGGTKGNAVLLQLGVEKIDELASLLLGGVREKHLALLGGELVLNQEGVALVPGTKAIGSDLSKIAIALKLVASRGDALVWPLYRKFDKDTGMPLISGFVVARIVAVAKEDGKLVFAIQPAQRTVAAAVTASSRGRTAERNRYLARLRLAE